MLAKIDKSLHIINKAYWHMICHSFYGDYVMQRKAKRGYRIATGLSPDRSKLTITSRAAAICSADSDVSTSTRRVASTARALNRNILPVVNTRLIQNKVNEGNDKRSRLT